MSEEQQAPEQTQQPEQAEQQSAPELPDDVKAQLEELERLKSHHSKLMDETKSAKQKAQELEEAQRQAEEDRLKKEGEFQKLYETEAEKAQRLQREMEEKEASWRDREKARQQRDIESEAIKVMHEIAVDESSLELLAEKAQHYAVYTEDGIEYEIGGVKVSKDKVIETLSQKYPRLVKGSGATGGGATGSGRPGGAGDSNSAAQAAKSKGDLNGFLTAQLNQ